MTDVAIFETDAPRAEIDKSVAGKNIATQFLDTVAARPDGVALRWKTGDDWEELTWRQYADQVASLAGGLAGLGVREGDRVVMMLRNRHEFHLIDTAVLFLGATPISIYNSSSAEQVAYLASHCRAKVALVEDTGFLDRFIKARDKLKDLESIAIIDDAGGTIPSGILKFSDLASGAPIDLESAARGIDPAALATVIYTSGTTGPPKGVMLSHYNVCWTVEAMRRLISDSISGKRMVSYLPMAHIAERMMSYYQHIILGAQVTPCPEVPQLNGLVAEIRPEIFLGVPRIWEKLYAGIQAVVSSDPEKSISFAQALDVGRKCAQAREDGKALAPELQSAWEVVDGQAFGPLRAMIGLDKLESALSGAAPIPHEVFDFFRAIGIPLTEIYGLSETCGPTTWERFKVRPRTVGRAIPGSELKLLDDGEVLTFGGNVFVGYLNDPERTAEVLDDDGWFHTGDIGEIDIDGYLKIVDRKKELIITAGGKNISPANIEAALKSIPLVGQACVIGDAKPFISALLVLDPDVAPSWAKSQGIEAATLKELAANPDVYAEVERGVTEANKEFNKAEQVKRFTLLGDEWLPDSEELTPTMKLKRRGVHSRYAREIEDLYS